MVALIFVSYHYYKYKTGAAIKKNITFSLSLQTEIEKRRPAIPGIISLLTEVSQVISSKIIDAKPMNSGGEGYNQTENTILDTDIM